MKDKENSPDGETTALATTAADVSVVVRASLLETLQKLAATTEDEVGKKGLLRLCRTIDPDNPMLESVDVKWTPPIVRLVQNMTREKPDGAAVGDLYTTDGTLLKPPIKLTPVFMFETNRMFPPGNTMGAPVCVAPDAKLGNSYGLCAKCINFPLGKNPTGQMTECDNVLNLLMMSEKMRILHLEFSRTSLDAGRKIISLIHNVWDEPHEYWVSLGSKQKTNQAGNAYHVFTSSDTGEETPTEVRKAAGALFAMFRAERNAMLTDYRASQMSHVQTAVDESTMDGDASGAPAAGDNPDLTGKI